MADLSWGRNGLCTSIQRGGTFLHDGLSIPCRSAPPQVEAVVAVAIQALEGEVGHRGVIYCLHLHGAVITLHNWPRHSPKKTFNHYLIFNTSLWPTRYSGWHVPDWWASLGGFAFDPFSRGIDLARNISSVVFVLMIFFPDVVDAAWKHLLNKKMYVPHVGDFVGWGCKRCLLCWYCSRYPMRTPLGWSGGVQ